MDCREDENTEGIWIEICRVGDMSSSLLFPLYLYNNNISQKLPELLLLGRFSSEFNHGQMAPSQLYLYESLLHKTSPIFGILLSSCQM